MALSASALCTLDDLKTELGLSGSSEDTRLERLIEAASDAISRYCARSFHYEAARVDDMKGYGSVLMHLPKTPVIEIASIVFDPDGANETLDADEYRIDNAAQGRIYREGGWQWTAAMERAILLHPLPGTEASLYRVTYECGYVTANQVDLDEDLERTLPDDLEDACLQLAALRYRWKPRDPAVAGESLMSWSAQYRGGSSGAERGTAAAMPAEVAGILDAYRRVAFG